MSCKNCIFYLVVLLLLFNVSACTKSNAAEKGQIFGRITLDGISDHSGIAVSVYPAGLVPEAVVGIREQYPQLAFPITDREAFDHRQHEALQMVYTDQTGSFSFSKLPYNKYIVAYCKEGWGYNYLLDLELNSGELDLSVINSILCPEQELPSYIDGQYTLEDGKCYVVKNDLVLGESAQFVFQEGSRLLIDRNVRISSYGAITFPDDGRAYVTSYSGVYSGNIDEANLGNGLYLYSGSNELKNLSFSHLRNALQVTVNGFTIENLSFKDCTFGFVSRAMTNLAVKNCYFQDNESTDTAACYGYDIQGYLAEYNIFSGNYIAVKNEIVKEATVSNNAFVDNTLSFFNSYESTAEFINNNLNSTGIGVENTGKSNFGEILNNKGGQKPIITTLML